VARIRLALQNDTTKGPTAAAAPQLEAVLAAIGRRFAAHLARPFSESYVAVHTSWYLVSLWNAGISGLGMLRLVPAADSISTLITRTLTLAPLDAVIAGVDRTESVGNLVLAAGLATKIWVVFLSPRISALVSLFEKLHKPPNARVLQKTVGFNGTN